MMILKLLLTVNLFQFKSHPVLLLIIFFKRLEVLWKFFLCSPTNLLLKEWIRATLANLHFGSNSVKPLVVSIVMSNENNILILLWQHVSTYGIFLCIQTVSFNIILNCSTAMEAFLRVQTRIPSIWYKITPTLGCRPCTMSI